MEATNVGIVGVGMMGGSIALAALRAGYGVYLYDRTAFEKLNEAKFRKASVAHNLAELVSKSRLIVSAPTSSTVFAWPVLMKLSATDMP